MFRVGLAKLLCRSFVSGVSCWAFAVFLLERHGGKFFVELAPLIVLFHVGLAWLYVGVVLSKWVLRWAFVLFFERRHGDNGDE